MEILRACETRVPFPGKYRGKPIARVGANDEGLLYLDQLRREGRGDAAFREALEAYLAHDQVAPKLHAAALD